MELNADILSALESFGPITLLVMLGCNLLPVFWRELRRVIHQAVEEAVEKALRRELRVLRVAPAPRTCVDCGAAVADDATFCVACGATVPATGETRALERL